MNSRLKPIWTKFPDLARKRPYPGYSVFPACTYNFGPAQSSKHLDPQNPTFGWCDLSAMGDYDPRLGGHLILWDLNIFVEFPPGTHILIPSAILYHSCTTIQEGETRYSFTQYCAGALLRWSDTGGKMVKNLKGKDKEAFDRIKSDRKEGFHLFSRYDDLRPPS
jgi:hypothetical protein